MNHIPEYSQLLTFIYPFFSGFTCAVLMFFSLKESKTRTEVKIKKITLIYLLVTAFNWFGSFLFGYYPEAFIYINTPLLISYIYAQIILYYLFHFLTRTKKEDIFSLWHHFIPFVLCTILLVWSLFVPYDVQLQIVQSRGVVFPDGYEVYGRYFTSKPLIRFIFSIVYSFLIVLRLIRYYRKVNSSPTLLRKPSRWILFLGILMALLIITPGIGTFTPRTVIFSSLTAKIAAFCIFCQQILLTYHIVRRDYMLYVTFSVEEENEKLKKNRKNKKEPVLKGTQSINTINETQQKEEKSENQDKKKNRKPYTHNKETLTKRNFEAYVNKYKPFLDTNIKITDLAETLETNRTYISNFVNKTYGVNFNRYINQCRLKEVEQLKKKHSNKEKTLRELVVKAGFSDYKHYSRARAIEEESKYEAKYKQHKKFLEDE